MRHRGTFLTRALTSALFLSACAPSAEQLRDSIGLTGDEETESQSPEEQEQNRLALEELIARARAVGMLPPDSTATVVTTDSGEVAQVQEVPLREEATAEPVEPFSGTVRRSEIAGFVERGPHAVLGAIVLEPARNSGDTVLGMRIAEFLEGSEYAQVAGFRVGDVIESVNGRTVIDPDSFLRTFEGLASVEAIVIEYVREGESLVIEVPVIDDLAAN